MAQHCAHLSDQAIIEAADRFVAGEVVDQSKKFAPSVAEFVEEAKRREEYLQIRQRPRLEAPKYTPGPKRPFEIAIEQARQRFRGRPIIAEDVSHGEFLRLSKTRQLPVGAVWCAALATIFGPEPSVRQEAA